MSATPSNAAIEIRGVSRIYGSGENRVTALSDVFVDIRENEFFTLLGPSGCGKTTLLRLIAGFDFPTKGEILLNGEDIAPLPPFKRPVNTVFQSYALFPHMTVEENISFGLEMLGKPKGEIKARTGEMLELVHMTAMRDRAVSQISGGQQQRVALARALAPKPEVLLLDEPLSALDYKLRKEMQFELKRVQSETGITFIFVTHDQEEALTMSDRIAVMSNGEVRQIGSAREIYDRPADRFVADFIGESNFLEGTITATGENSATVALAGGTTITAALPAGQKHSGNATVVVRPEHATLGKAGTGAFDGTLEEAVYFGTDTHFHIRLETGELFIVREQNRRGGGDDVPATGQRVSVHIGPEAAQILRD
ncbi:ABC transporter ATP-binding protein [Pseudohoeflea suaedae]|uniref:ABC transporter ATP-binding protein n=1 Tax=Pseudohoeflea suaedae TaxID=877384 RepID=UPI001FCE8A13|nr:ABC transporter ATP-binding protein [Pseudohoeflea suaedae]